MTIVYGTRDHWDRVAGVRGAASTDVSVALGASMLEGRALTRRRLLDVGTGNGNLPIRAALAGAEALGIDITEPGVRLAAANADEKLRDPDVRGRVSFRAMDVAALDLPDRSFDVITVLKTIWCLPDIPAASRELRRVLAPNGDLVIQLWSSAEDCSLLMVGATLLAEYVTGMHMPEGYRGPFGVTPRYMRGVLTRAGFTRFSMRRHAFTAEFGSPEEYWALVRSLAGSAYYALTLLDAAQRRELDARLWEALEPVREGDCASLDLEWIVLTTGYDESLRLLGDSGQERGRT
ncbi:class I SAM-dependent methyltransferase [Sandaracinus amylolyticus]|uniref:Methyltransferase type 11 n=1 Tax=Sandaracinus amylolyticus TaxID=927083 RepID=A0A0F6YH16_9BACT|nr:class I SAM-dependent methyltransferase [Sandaracinus amylolyticus]AKF04307.1 Methyltransferase type 11 [Sandaracinus amylolyticus]